VSTERVVHIVEDDTSVRRSLQWLLQSAGFATNAYATAFACLHASPQLTEGCLLLDVQMPEMDGLQLQGRLAAVGVELPVIVVSGQADVTTAVRAMKAGAVDFIEKPYEADGLVEAIESAMEKAGRPAIRGQTAKAAARIAMLSPREREVLDGLVAGRLNRSIAFDLAISIRTVEMHRARMLKRLGTRRLAEAVRLAVLAKLA
jgi:two-component system, LuxR family, response regulator FixJ